MITKDAADYAADVEGFTADETSARFTWGDDRVSLTTEIHLDQSTTVSAHVDVDQSFDSLDDLRALIGRLQFVADHWSDAERFASDHCEEVAADLRAERERVITGEDIDAMAVEDRVAYLETRAWRVLAR
ncbi:hypothetical protein LH935_16520 [Gordonia polyisoprenivorans]|uniref:hypothetical protein n=1 Tax=Gordonia polyisoprenivorans TaxID=84595 RepID=UPI002233FA21|nr:hypothetical protein LH935_16520 [Gordonia polyisoprenivorans]